MVASPDPPDSGVDLIAGKPAPTGDVVRLAD
jgi:hypothetical protein